MMLPFMTLELTTWYWPACYYHNHYLYCLAWDVFVSGNCHSPRKLPATCTERPQGATPKVLLWTVTYFNFEMCYLSQPPCVHWTDSFSKSTRLSAGLELCFPGVRPGAPLLITVGCCRGPSLLCPPFPLSQKMEGHFSEHQQKAWHQCFSVIFLSWT